MPRYKLTIEYDGTPFSGWQRQSDRPSVQQALEEAIARMSGETVTTQAAGRTDAGVHALGQVAHFDLGKDWDPFRIREALNFHLRPDPVAIIAAEAVPESFEARFSATARHYEYRILTRRAPPVIERNHVWHIPKSLDAQAMDHAASLILGSHDFTTFRSAECQANSPIRTLDRFTVRAEPDHVVVNASARSFLHHQVRSMVGSLRMVGEGKWSPRDFRAALDARDRTRCGAMAPSAGLYLTDVTY
ncbi:MAG: tRNA pseudouridine(38-40) synthase TruA [Candidatus Devosia phytovorans]|uniref:tRNA pseudouridine synthase A n=1 Tax=Candidatus Devosia phytovorans TaxID=3121372 RepID=A0AAJ5VUD9_9HYPH|nr:tRNA pseudouridine(38-40) synthase TruA [Devosia sp.]WEK03544.1 MAG: tRNA pseudouridine(38-40) synthase TruA [Devosia sp.]